MKVGGLIFDISKESTEIWATYIPTRIPEFKIYNKKRAATSSLRCNERLGGNTWKTCAKLRNKLYKLVDGKWVEQSD
jgi:hypothetical protein